MSLLILFAAVPYGLVGFVVGCRAATLFAWHMARVDYEQWHDLYRDREMAPSSEQWCGAGALGIVVVCVWPVVALCFAFRGTLFAPPRDVQMKRQQDHIAALEKELELTR